MGMVAEVQRCVVCGAVTREGLLCPNHREEAEAYNAHLRGVSKYETLRTSTLTVDRRFQRPLNERLIKEITLDFNEYDLGTLTVSRRAHEQVLLDGQQRWTALVRLGFAEAPCEVLERLSFEQETMIFVVRNEHRRAVTKAVLFRDKALAGQSSYAEAMSILRAFNYEVIDLGPRGMVKVNQLSCPGAIEKVHAMGRLASVLAVIRQAWPEEAEANRAEVIMGIAAFQQLNPHIKPNELGERLSHFRASEVVNMARAAGKASMERRLWVHLYNAVIERFNFNKPNHTRIPRQEIPRNAPGIWVR